jgi:hypothetical protein
MTEMPQEPQPSQPPQGPQPAGGAGGEGPPGKGLAIASMVLGIAGLALFCIWYIALPASIVGLILAIVSKKQARAAGVAPSGMAKAGLILCIIALALDVVITILALVGIAVLGDKAEEMQWEMEQGGGRVMLQTLRNLLA